MSNRQFFNFEGIGDFAELFDHPLILITTDDSNDCELFVHNYGEFYTFFVTLLQPIS
jgi:hypothetical protein